MQSMLALAAPLALVLPLLGQVAPSQLQGIPAEPSAGEHSKPVAKNTPVSDPTASLPASATPLEALYRSNVVRQVRIEQRVVVRISPQRSNQRANLLAQTPQRELATRFEERKMDKCIPVERIAGVQTGSGTRLLLFLRDRRIITANLEKACSARDFYSGFYVEKNKDGKLCVSRDKLQSRSGAKCEVARMRQLVAVTD